MDDTERKRRIARLLHLGVPQAFQFSIADRPRPRFHILTHAAVILVSIGLAVLAMVAWSRLVDHAAEIAAQAAAACLYNSDLGLESLGGLFTVLFGSGWLCAWLTRRRGSEIARNGTAYDLIHEPAKNKAIVDQLWRWMIVRHRTAAQGAEDFLDRLTGGLGRYLRIAALGSLAATIVLAWMLPAHYSLTMDGRIEDHPLLPWSPLLYRPFGSATTVTTGCPVLPRDGSTLIYRVLFADGTEADLGSWRVLAGDQLAALEQIASHLPSGIGYERFSNPIGNTPLNPDCLRRFGGEPGSNRMARLVTLLALTEAEKVSLRGRI